MGALQIWTLKEEGVLLDYSLEPRVLSPRGNTPTPAAVGAGKPAVLGAPRGSLLVGPETPISTEAQQRRQEQCTVDSVRLILCTSLSFSPLRARFLCFERNINKAEAK